MMQESTCRNFILQILLHLSAGSLLQHGHMTLLTAMSWKDHKHVRGLYRHVQKRNQ